MVSPRARWSLELPPAGALKTYCHEVLDRVLDKLTRTGNAPEDLYPFRLVLAHEDMRGEAMAAAMHSLGITAPFQLVRNSMQPWAQGEIRFPGGTMRIGSEDDGSFVFEQSEVSFTDDPEVLRCGAHTIRAPYVVVTRPWSHKYRAPGHAVANASY